MKISITTYREIVRALCTQNLSFREIAQLTFVHHKTVWKVQQKLDANSLSHETLKTLDDKAFIDALSIKIKHSAGNKIVPNWLDIYREMQLENVTLALLWEEYRALYRDQHEDCLSYSHFSRKYRGWLKKQSISMRQCHRPGDKVFVDFCGSTLPIVDADTGVAPANQCSF